ncbi:MAG: glycosyltransferase family 2 protein [Clostridiales bacterium]|nr:glycosyltransferase family 2 protein [Clostridiales bacterium]
MKLSLVVPCYNEEGNVEEMSKAVEKAFLNCGFDYEIVFVNDGSMDNTYNVLNEIYKSSPQNIKVVNFSRNFGKESAIFAGLKESRGDIVAIIDADLQQRPEIVLEMVKMLDEDKETDCITAYQETRKEGAVSKLFKNMFYKIINKFSETEFVKNASDFRAMRREMVDAILQMEEYFRFSKGIFSWVGFNTKYIPYTAEKRFSGETKWSFRKLFKYAVDGIISFTTLPLKISIAVGFITSLLSIIYLIVVVIQKLCFDINVPGYATIVVLVLLLGGIQLLCLGILGEYMGKTYMETKKRPIYIARNVLDYKDKDQNS